ncbi:MAG: ACP S-malonyltransferase, partial [Chloroflexota bacterium]|nr:ACP S-malonyltransferase [Chloroflexota bacterium]
QKNGMILLTANRRMREEDSLEETIRNDNTPTSLPVLTIGNINRMIEKTYREQCATRLLEIGLDLENYLGTGRIFIP